MTQRETLEQFHAQLMAMVPAVDTMQQMCGRDTPAVGRLSEACDDIILAATAIKSVLRLELPDEAIAAR